MKCATTLLLLAAAAAIPALADTFTDIGFFTTSSSSLNVSGTADFRVDTTTNELYLTLDNTSNVTEIAKILDGFNFVLTGGSGLTLESVVPPSITDPFVDCTNGSCIAVSTYVDYKDSSDTGSPFNWALAGGAPYVLNAGSTSLHPAGIVNPSILGNTTQFKDHPHNDMILSNVTFIFDGFTLAPTAVSDVVFKWGTNPDLTDGVNTPPPVPEPASLLLLGTVAAGAFLSLRRRLRQSS